MAHRTQLYLDDHHYEYLKKISLLEKKSITQVVRDWIEEKQQKNKSKKYEKDSFWKICKLGKSGKSDIAQNFDDDLYGNKK